LLGWLFYRFAIQDEERQQLLDLAADRGIELSEDRAARAAQAGTAARLRERLLNGEVGETPALRVTTETPSPRLTKEPSPAQLNGEPQPERVVEKPQPAQLNGEPSPARLIEQSGSAPLIEEPVPEPAPVRGSPPDTGS
jgi:hypothetical protein